MSLAAHKSTVLDFQEFRDRAEFRRRIAAQLTNETNVLLSRDPGSVPDEGIECDLEEACISGVCDDGVCTAPSCSDGVLNFAFETDVDCGGALCPEQCSPGSKCLVDTDCAYDGSCENSTCKVGFGLPCQFDSHCLSEHCDPDRLTCTYIKPCFDAEENGNETDVDCGGVDCAPCPVGKDCMFDTDCSSGECLFGTCVRATPTPTPTASVTATPSETASTTTTATVGTSPTPTSSVTPSLTPTGTPSRTPGATIELSLFAPKFPLFHNGISGSSPFIVMAIFNIDITNPELGPGDFVTTCIDIFEETWIEVRTNLTYSFTARIQKNCPHDATLTLPRFAAGATHDISDVLRSRFTGEISPSPTPTASVTANVTTTPSVTPTPTSSMTPLEVNLFAIGNSQSVPLNADPLSFLLTSNYELVNLEPSLFDVAVNGSSTGQERVSQVLRMQTENTWLVKLEHLRAGIITITLPAGAVKDDRGVLLTNDASTSAWYDAVNPEMELLTPISKNGVWKNPFFDIILRVDKPVNLTVEANRPESTGRSLTHADPAFDFRNGSLMWISPLFSTAKGARYADGSKVELESEILNSKLSREFEYGTIFHVRTDVSQQDEGPISLTFFPPLLVDVSGNRLAHTSSFEFIRDVKGPQIEISFHSIKFPSVEFSLVGHEPMTFVNVSTVEYRGCDETGVCSDDSIIPSQTFDETNLPPLKEKHILVADISTRPETSSIGVFIVEGGLRDRFGNPSEESSFPSLVSLEEYSLSLFRSEEGLSTYVLITIVLHRTSVDELVSPTLDSVVDITASASTLLSRSRLAVKTMGKQENKAHAATTITFIHQDISVSSLRQLDEDSEALLDEKTKANVEKALLKDLSAAIPVQLFEGGIINGSDLATVESVQAVGFPEVITPPAAVKETASTSMVASTSVLGALLLLIALAALGIYVLRRKKASKQRQTFIAQENSAFGQPGVPGKVARVIDDTVPVEGNQDHGSALKHEISEESDDASEADIYDEDFECNLREGLSEEDDEEEVIGAREVQKSDTTKAQVRPWE